MKIYIFCITDVTQHGYVWQGSIPCLRLPTRTGCVGRRDAEKGSLSLIIDKYSIVYLELLFKVNM